jgi:TonB-dependent receptor
MCHRTDERARRAAGFRDVTEDGPRASTDLNSTIHRTRAILWTLASFVILVAGAPARAADPAELAGPTGQTGAVQTQSTATVALPDDKSGDSAVSEVVVTGVRRSEEDSISLKYNAASIRDSISAEDIGKLPDATISDSLQRITGVQIDRSGGEGSSINIRGLPQVGTFLNGEAFLTTGSIVSVQPNFTDIPSQLFAGADVIKAATADILNGGITGTVNLRTRRPEDLPQGWTVVGAADGAHGFTSDQYQPETNGLIAYNGGRWGVLLGAAYSDLTLNNTTDGMDQFGGAIFGENAASTQAYNGFLGAFGAAPIPGDIHQLGGGNVDVNGNGNSNDAFYGSENFTYLDRKLERKRLGLNGSVQGDLGGGFSVTGDWFFTDQQQWNRIVGYQFNSSAFLGATFVPLVSTNTGVTVTGPYNDHEGWNQTFYTTQVYKKWLGDMETYSENDFTESTSHNYNLELNYDNGGNLTGTLRGVYAHAAQTLVQSYVQFSDSDGSAWPNSPANAAPPGTFIYPADLGGNRVFNPAGFVPNTLPIIVDTRGAHLSFSLPQSLQNFLANENNYSLKTISSEGNYDRDSTMDVLRADGHYKFDDSALKLDFGVRRGERSAENTNYVNVAPVYAGDGASDPGGCYVHYKAGDVVLDGGGVAGACTAGNSQGYFRAGVLSAQNPSQLPALISSNIQKYNIGGVSFYNLNPAAMDNPLAFQNALYPGEVRDIDPGGTWRVELDQTSGYFKADFAGNLGIPYSVNAGARVVKTDLHVTQHLTGAAQPYGLESLDAGTVVTNRSFTDVLPAINLAMDFTEKLKLRLAYSKNMQVLNLDQWGGGLTLNYGIDTSTPGSTLFRVLGGNSTGNPNLDPWRSSNYDASLEYYANRSTLINFALFYISVKSFISNGSVQNCDLPDEDGVVRHHCVSITEPIQGSGANLKGTEIGIKQAFDFLPGFLRYFGVEANFTYSPSNTGVDLAGNKIPFQDNSAEQANAILWYQNNKFQVRLAGNHRSKRAVSQNFGGITGLEEYQAATFYLDASAAYDFTSNFEGYVQASNLTNERERYYLVWPSQVASTNQFETRLAVGVRARF